MRFPGCYECVYNHRQFSSNECVCVCMIARFDAYVCVFVLLRTTPQSPIFIRRPLLLLLGQKRTQDDRLRGFGGSICLYIALGVLDGRRNYFVYIYIVESSSAPLWRVLRAVLSRAHVRLGAAGLLFLNRAAHTENGIATTDRDQQSSADPIYTSLVHITSEQQQTKAVRLTHTHTYKHIDTHSRGAACRSCPQNGRLYTIVNSSRVVVARE